MPLSFSILAIILYLTSAFLQGINLIKHSRPLEIGAIISGLSVIAIHGILLSSFIYYQRNLNIFVLISLAFWFINFLAYLSFLGKKNIQSLTLFTFPLTIISLLLTIIFAHTPSLINISNLKQLFHITLSTLTFTTILFSVFQAIILAIQDRKLRKHHRGFTSLLPPIEAMETSLLQTLIIGFFLFTTLLISSVILFSDIDSQKFNNKLILSFTVWLILAILLAGRFYSGWRGPTLIRWTLWGSSLLILIYFGSLFSGQLLLK